MSLIVNGVSIPQTEGAIKVGATNVQKVVVNTTTVWEVPQGGYTIKWRSSALAKYGSFINSTSPAKSTTSNYTGKQIRYTKPDGSIAVANPYDKSGSIVIKEGTVVYLDMYAGNSTSDSSLFWYVNSDGIGVVKNIYGSLLSYGYAPTGDCTFIKMSESVTSGQKSGKWGVNAKY